MKRNNKIIAVLFILYLSLIVISPVFADNATTTSQQTNTINSTRLSGQSRYETAKAIAESYNQGKVRNVILSTGNGFADALSASVLSHQKEAPILLVDNCVDGSKDAYDYITRHLDKTGTVYIIGGTGIIGKEFETRLNFLGFKNIMRIAGNDRYETSYKLARSLNNTIDTAVISSGESYPDALSIAGFAANKGWPILLTQQNALPQKIKDFLLEKKPSKVYITGGLGVISENVKTKISSLLPQASVERLAGQSRFDTNATIAQTFKPNPTMVYLATGYGFADALAGSTLAAINGDPIMFVDSATPTLPKSVAGYLGKLSAGSQSPSLIIFGGSGVVADEVIKNSSDLISGVVKEDSIYSIEDIAETTTQNQSYTLPKTVPAKLYNSNTIEISVKWNPSSVDTSKIGSSIYAGIVDGYSKSVKLTLFVIPQPQPSTEDLSVPIKLDTDYNIIVSIKDQSVTVINHGIIVKTMVCSTGLDSSPTPQGNYKTNGRGYAFFSPKYSEGAFYWIRIIGNYLFHSIPFDENREIIPAEAEKLGQKASHGCIRLSLEDSKWLYNNVPAYNIPIAIQ